MTVVHLVLQTTTVAAEITTETPGNFGNDVNNALWMTAVGMGGVALLGTAGLIAFKTLSSG